MLRREFEVVEPALQVVHAGVGGKAIDLLNLHPHRMGLFEDSDGRNAVQDLPSKRPNRLVPHKKKRGFWTSYLSDKVMLNSSSCNHPRTGHDDG